MKNSYFIVLILLLVFLYLFLTNAKANKIRKVKSRLSHLNKKLGILLKWKYILDKKSGRWYKTIKAALFTFIILLEIGIAYFFQYDIATVAVVTKASISALYIGICATFCNKVYPLNEALELTDNWVKGFIYKRDNFDPREIELTQDQIELCKQELKLLEG